MAPWVLSRSRSKSFRAWFPGLILILCFSLAEAQLASAAGIQRTIPRQWEGFRLQQVESKIAPDLWEVVGAMRSLRPEQREELALLRADHINLPLFKLSGHNASLLQVYIHVRDTSALTLDILRRTGAQLELVNSDSRLIQARIPLDKVETFAELACVRKLSRPNYSICNVGKYTSAADNRMGTSRIRASQTDAAGNALDGKGVRIGVLSVGLFDTLFSPQGGNSDRRIASGDIPRRSPVDPNMFGAVRLFPSFAINTNDYMVPNPATLEFDPWRPIQGRMNNRMPVPTGALMLEALYDIAPGASYLFGDASTDEEFFRNRQTLVNQGAQILVDDAAFPGVGRYDGSSALSNQATQFVNLNDVVCITAVGDYTPPPSTGTPAVTAGKPIYINTYFNATSPNQGKNYHGFSRPDAVIRDETLEIAIDPTLGFFEAYLVWDDVWVNKNYKDGTEKQGQATDDIDMYIIDRATLNSTSPIAFSTLIQNGGAYNPVERIMTSNNSNDLSLVIHRKNIYDRRPTLMTLVITAGVVEEPNYITHGIPLCNSDALDVISVGAISLTPGTNIGSVDVIAEDTIPGRGIGPGAQYYNRFIQWRAGAQKPEVCCYDNVETFTGRERYPSDLDYYARGSSIAAAHVAGFCVLLRQKFPDLPAKSFLSILSSSTSPDGDPLHANAIPIMTSLLSYTNAPSYKRLEAENAYSNMFSGITTPRPILGPGYVRYLFNEGPGYWTSGPTSGSPYFLPEFSAESDRLVIKSNKMNTYGFWDSPVLRWPDAQTGELRSALDPSKLYCATIRIGTDQPDPQRVPDFRIRLISISNDEAVMLVVSGRTSEGLHAPSTPEGREYKLYYQPTPEVAAFGVRLAVDMINFHTTDDEKASLFINEMKFEELDTPTATAP